MLSITLLLLVKFFEATIINHDIYQVFPDSGNSLLDLVLQSNTINSTLLKSHGCWCSKLDTINSTPNTSGGEAIDELDNLCKQWFKTRHCNDDLVGGSCYNLDPITQAQNYYYQVQYDDNQLSSLHVDKIVNSAICNSVNQITGRVFEDCEKDSCLIDLHFVQKIFSFLVVENPGFLENSSVLTEGEGNYCENSGATHIPFECVGTAPNLRIISELKTTELPQLEQPNPVNIDGNCYVDQRNRDCERTPGHNYDVIPSNQVSSIYWCLKHCYDLNFTYATTQYSRECFCCNGPYGKYGQADMSKCNKRCQDQEKNFCGGTWHQNVYEARRYFEYGSEE